MSAPQPVIHSRVAVFAGAALGGVYWGLLGIRVMMSIGRADDRWIDPVELIVFIAASLVIFAIGWVFLRAWSAAARTSGVALILCALSGWLAFGAVGLQSALWWS